METTRYEDTGEGVFEAGTPLVFVGMIYRDEVHRCIIVGESEGCMSSFSRPLDIVNEHGEKSWEVTVSMECRKN